VAMKNPRDLSLKKAFFFKEYPKEDFKIH